MARLEFFFDCSSPWTYLAFDQIEGICEEAGAELQLRPILVGGVFNAINPSVYEQRANPTPSKMRYYAKDLADWIRRAGLRIGSPPVFPVNSVKAMRGCLFAEESGCLSPYARAVFDTYWGDLEDISKPSVLQKILARVDLDEEKFFEHIQRSETKTWLRENTEELIERGGFGSPTIFVNRDDMYFGNDRLILVRDALAKESS